MLMVGTSMNGIRIIGFNTIGRPNTSGSLIPKIPGINASLPNSLTRLERQKSSMAISRDRVEPQPPKVANRSWNCWEIMFGSTAPAWNAARFSAESVCRIGLNTAPTTEPPFTPKDQKK